MIDVSVFLLPISGGMLLNRLIELDFINIKTAVIPHSFKNDCNNIMSRLNKKDIPFTVPSELSDSEFGNWYTSFDLDVGVSVGYDKKIPIEYVEHPQYGTLNIHPSLLPDYRGANPYFWTLRNRESETGVTLHRMDEDFDTGPILFQQSVSLSSDETMGTLFFLLNSTGIDLVSEVLEHLYSRDELPPSDEQSSSNNATKAPRVIERHLRIDWEEHFGEIDAHVRAGNPFFGSFTTFRGHKIRIYEVKNYTASLPSDSTQKDYEPGSIIECDGGPIVRCGDGWAQLKVVQVGQRYKSSGEMFQKREGSAFEVLDKVI